jgi:hypothetical protein
VIGLIVTCMLYVPIITMMLLRRRFQPLRHRSPILGLICLFSSFITVLGILFILFLNPLKNNQNSFSCMWMGFDLSTLHYLLSYCIIFRAFRLISVFDHNQKIDFKKTQLKESLYLKVIFL